MASQAPGDDKKLVDPDAFSDIHDDDDETRHIGAAASAAAAAARQKRRRNLAALSIGLLPLALFILLYWSSTSHGSIFSGGLLSNFQSSEKKPQLYHLLPSDKSREPDPVSGKFPPRKAIVIASYQGQLVNWIPDFQKLLPDWEIFRYESDVGLKDLDDDYDDVYDGVHTKTLTHKDGREPLAFMTFILDNYAKLPDYVAFVHGHRHSWHQPEHIVDVIMALNLTAVDDEKFVNFRCAESHGCVPKTYLYYAHPEKNFMKNRGANYIEPFWNEVMKPWGYGSLPPVIARRCCAQFAVPKDAILAQPYQFWQTFGAPIVKKPRWHGKDSHTMGLYYETLWHMVFGKPEMFCPSEERCHKVHFSGALRCACRGIMPCYINKTELGWTNMPCKNDFRTTRLESHWPYMQKFEQKYPPNDTTIKNPWKLEYPGKEVFDTD